MIFLFGVIELIVDGSDGPVRRPVVTARVPAEDHDVHDPLQINVPVRLLVDFFPGHVGAKHSVVEIGIDLLGRRVDVFVRVRDLLGFGIENIHPGQLAETQVIVSETDSRVGDQCPGLVLKSRERAQQVRLDEPGGRVMCPDIAGHGIGRLHGKGSMGPIEREGKPLRLHGEFQEIFSCIDAAVSPRVLPGNPFDQGQHSPAGRLRELGFPAGDLMDESQRGFFIPPGQLHPVRVFPDQISSLEALHDKSDDDGYGDGIDSVVIAVPVGLHDEFGVPHPHVGTKAGGRFVFGAVHPDLPAFLFSGFQGHPASLGAPQRAAGKTPVHAAVFKKVFRVVFACNVLGSRIGAQLVIVHGERLVFVLVHEGDQSRAALAVHLQRYRVDFPDHAVEF